MKIKAFVAAVLCGLVLTACATQAKYEAMLETWVGKHVDELVLSWGPPQGAFDLSDGRKIIEYREERTIQMSGRTYTTSNTTYGLRPQDNRTTYSTHTTPGHGIDLSCKTRFTISKNGIIAKWSTEGNDCTAS